MTQFAISCELYLRLAGMALQPDENNRQVLRCVRIEHRAGVALAVASNAFALAGEYMGALAEGEPDGAVNIVIDPALQALATQSLDGDLIINQAPGWTVITTSDGVMFPGNGELPGDYPDWRALVPGDLPTKNNGCFCFSGALLSRLCKTAPCGVIRCARNIDMSQPTIVRDIKDENWFGIFFVSDGGKEQSFKPATIPDFLK